MESATQEHKILLSTFLQLTDLMLLVLQATPLAKGIASFLGMQHCAASLKPNMHGKSATTEKDRMTPKAADSKSGKHEAGRKPLYRRPSRPGPESSETLILRAKCRSLTVD
eukprot:6419213-Karenia_brevis.AAC.1